MARRPPACPTQDAGGPPSPDERAGDGQHRADEPGGVDDDQGLEVFPQSVGGDRGSKMGSGTSPGEGTLTGVAPSALAVALELPGKRRSLRGAESAVAQRLPGPGSRFNRSELVTAQPHHPPCLTDFRGALVLTASVVVLNCTHPLPVHVLKS